MQVRPPLHAAATATPLWFYNARLATRSPVIVATAHIITGKSYAETIPFDHWRFANRLAALDRSLCDEFAWAAALCQDAACRESQSPHSSCLIRERG
jgi:hypothetical protein